MKNILQNGKPFYVSITGLKVKSMWKFIFFMRHAIQSKIQAEKAPGLLFLEVRTLNGIQHTLTAWESKKHIQAFVYSGSHAKAIKVFRKIASGKTFGYETSQLPTWEEVCQLWEEKGKVY